MVDEEIEKIKKLPPHERIERLKELEEKRRKEIEETEKLLNMSRQEIIDEEKNRRIIEIPKEDDRDLSRIFRGEDEEGLEGAVKDAKPLDDNNIGYMTESTQELYQRAVDLYNIAQQGNLTSEQGDELYSIRREVENRRSAIKSGDYNPSTQVRKQLNVMDSITDKLGVYR